MAKEPVKQEDEVIDVGGDDGDVTIELGGVAAAAEGEEGQQERKRLNKEQLIPPPEEPVVEDEATLALRAAAEQAKKDQEAADARARAAEATAAAERARAEEAQRRAAAAEQQTQSALEQAADRELEMVVGSIATTQSEKEALEAQLADLYEKGEFKLAATVQGKLASAAAKLDRLEAAKVNLENRPAPAQRTEADEGITAPANSQQERFLAQFTPASQSWLRQHSECMPPAVGGNAQAYNKMMAGHHAAIAAGIPPESAEYFRVIEEHTGYRQKENPVPPKITEEDPGVSVQQRQQQPAPRQAKVQPSAPPSRDPPSNGIPRSTRQVTLNPQQKEAARISFPHMNERDAYVAYAKNLVELEAEGKMGRMTH